MNLLRLRARAQDERGVVAVIVALLLVVLGGSAALTFDLARLRHERHLIQAAVDLGSLAGAAYLPVSDVAGAAIATAAAEEIAIKNAPQLETLGLEITFACVVEGSGGEESDACGPAEGTEEWGSGWTVKGGRAIHDCNPNIGDLCNTIRVRASSTVDYYFAPLIGFDEGSTGSVAAAACKGTCGPAAVDLDIVFIVDRSRSMSDGDVANVRNALANNSAEADSVLELYDPDHVHIGLVALPYKNQSNCNVGTASTQTYPALVPDLWQVVGLSDDYRGPDNRLVPASTLVSRIQCLQRAGSITVRPFSGVGHTDYGDPLHAAQSILDNDPNARDDAEDVIVFMGDGEANQPFRTEQPCAYAVEHAGYAKAAGTTVFSLAYGAGAPGGGGSGENPTCSSDDSGFWRDAVATTMFAAVASPRLDGGPTDDNDPGGCAADENTDGDRYFCEERGENLRDVFLQIVEETVQYTRLLNF